MRQFLALGSTCMVLTCVAIFAGTNVSAFDESTDPATQDFYAKRVTAILQANCLKCHDETARGGLQLDSYSLIRKGGQDGQVIVPGDPDASLLIQAIRRTGDLKMPPKYALKDTEVAVLEAWVKAGAVGSDDIPTPAPESASTQAQSNSSPPPPIAPAPV